MFGSDVLNNSLPESNNKIEKEMFFKKLKEEVLKRFEAYDQTMTYLATDAPISVLCLPKATEKLLLNSGFLRVYDLFNSDFTEIKGLGEIRIRDLTTRLDQFCSMF